MSNLAACGCGAFGKQQDRIPTSTSKDYYITIKDHAGRLHLSHVFFMHGVGRYLQTCVARER